jgi:hypothetical protein
VKTHVFGNQTFAIFNASEQEGVWMVQFIWGKKDFRIYLGGAGSVAGGPARLAAKAKEDLVVTRLQYLYNFDWYEFVRVADHGLASEKVLFKKDAQTRYAELPKEFYDIAVEIACDEFSLTRKDTKRRMAG